MSAEFESLQNRELEAEAASIARARADIAAGRVVEHEKVVEWLKTWGTKDEHPVPPEWLE